MVEDVGRGVRWDMALVSRKTFGQTLLILVSHLYLLHVFSLQVFQNIERYGGDTSNVLWIFHVFSIFSKVKQAEFLLQSLGRQVMLMGQSAGAHLAAMLLLEHGLLEARWFYLFLRCIFGLRHLTLEAKQIADGKDFNDNWSVKDCIFIEKFLPAMTLKRPVFLMKGPSSFLGHLRTIPFGILAI